jgi:beta-galactosidase
MKYILALLAFLISIQVLSQRITYNFNSSWKVFKGDTPEAASTHYNDATWKNVTLPYAWNEDEAFRKDIAELSTGIAWYRKHFKLPAIHQGQKVFIEFEGIRQAGDFYVNGKHIGLHENGAMAFGFDISNLVKSGSEENVIAVRIDNDWNYKEKATDTKFQWEDKNFNANYGGINKNVYLHITPAIYQTLPLFSTLGTTGVYIYADEFDIKNKSAVIHAISQVRNETGKSQRVDYEIAIKDPDNKTLKSFRVRSSTFRQGIPELWQLQVKWMD